MRAGPLRTSQQLCRPCDIDGGPALLPPQNSDAQLGFAEGVARPPARRAMRPCGGSIGPAILRTMAH
eukprot:13306515-Alexandrium_andersonii.AAC.1